MAEQVGWLQREVSRFTRNGNFSVLSKSDDSEAGESADTFKLTKAQLAAAEHATDFEIPLYNIWKQQEKSEGSKHSGNSEVRWVDNLLYLYTKPFDVVVDPFASGVSALKQKASPS